MDAKRSKATTETFDWSIADGEALGISALGTFFLQRTEFVDVYQCLYVRVFVCVSVAIRQCLW
jgi:hypothetical protein